MKSCLKGTTRISHATNGAMYCLKHQANSYIVMVSGSIQFDLGLVAHLSLVEVVAVVLLLVGFPAALGLALVCAPCG